MRPLLWLPLCLLLMFVALSAEATHNRAGEIRVEQIGDCNELTIRATIVTYTRQSSTVDRDTLTLCWGDGTCTNVPRSNGSNNRGESLGNDIKFNSYVSEHTYPGRATYRLSVTDPNRNANILNVNFPNSVNVPFHISTTYTFLNPQFQGCNSTPQLLQPPIDIGCVGQPFRHNPNAYDPDGDSLSYELIVPLQEASTPVPKYLFPHQINPGADNNLTIDDQKGDVIWDAPQEAGEYNLAMIIIEWRNGVPIDTTIRDMQITIRECENLPPEIETPFEEICVVAGDTIEFDVIATAPLMENEQRVRLQAFGGPLILANNPAIFELNNRNFFDQPARKQFRWVTDCEHISEQPYSIVFRAVDNFFDTTGLSTLKTIRIKIVGPPPEDVQAEGDSDQITVSWAKPYACEETEDEFFRGFSVWRKESSNPFPIDSCTTGLEGRGYERLVFNYTDMNPDGTRYVYQDMDVERGRTYCYRILAEFAKVSPNGNYAYNRVRSLPSDEVCVQLSRDIPLLTNVSILTTDVSAGSLEVRWSKPDANDLDTLQNRPPYRYEIFRAEGIDGMDFMSVGSFTSNSFAAANDTVFVDTNLNTLTTGYNYKVAFYVEDEAEALGETNASSSVFLSVSPTDEATQLSWEEIVSWNNTEYVIHQVENGVRTVLDTVDVANYRHEGLENGTNYCYVIESIGSYGIENVVNPILNFSQEACATPLDNVPPCAPNLVVQNICDDEVPIRPNSELENTLIWTNPNNQCPDTEDVEGYNIYYATNEGMPLELLDFVNGASDTLYFHAPENSIAGCYAVTAVDDRFNESAQSNIICVDNCPIYELPNTFTPNGDGQNDVYIPYPYRFVARVDMQIFNRWGQLVFETDNPDLNWTGKNLTGDDLAEGVYYYTCRVFENRVTGIVQQPTILQGFIHLIRAK